MTGLQRDVTQLPDLLHGRALAGPVRERRRSLWLKRGRPRYSFKSRGCGKSLMMRSTCSMSSSLTPSRRR